MLCVMPETSLVRIEPAATSSAAAYQGGSRSAQSLPICGMPLSMTSAGISSLQDAQLPSGPVSLGTFAATHSVGTDPTAPKHKGITCLLVDMHLPGVEVRPLTTITGESEFNEIFFTDVRVPASATLGPVNEGWRVAMTTLAYERGTVAKLHLGTRAKVKRLIELARTTPLGDGVLNTSFGAPPASGMLEIPFLSCA